MIQRMFAVAAVFVLISVAWFVLAGSVTHRTWSADRSLSGEVAGLWGEPQSQVSPDVVFRWRELREERESVKDARTGEERLVTRQKSVWRERQVILDASGIEVDLSLDQRRKGLLWYATYAVDFAGSYSYTHDEPRDGELVITYRFPTTGASYDEFVFEVDGVMDPKVTPVSEAGEKVVRQRIEVEKGRTVPFRIAYRSRGLDSWRYSFGQDVNRVKDFSLRATTDFGSIDFSDGTISPTAKQRAGSGWQLDWEFENLISGFSIGIEMPRRLNPGPLAARIALFAPVSLGFFFVWMFVITLLRDIRLHPLNFLFLGAAFFAFHLLFAYTVDHVDVRLAFLLSSAVSMLLVISYLRLVVGLRFAAVEAGLSQLTYLVLFSYAHFLEGLTGLAVTIGSIATLFLLMQITGRIDWEQKLRSASSRPAQPGALPADAS